MIHHESFDQLADVGRVSSAMHRTDAPMDERGCIGRCLNVDGPAEVEKKAFVPEEDGGFKIKECKTQVSFKSRDVLLVG